MNGLCPSSVDAWPQSPSSETEESLVPSRNPFIRIRSWFALEWIGDDDLYAQAVSEIDPGLLLGRRPTTDQLDDLARRGVTHIVSCIEERKRADVDALAERFNHLFIPADDAMDHDLGGAVEQFFSWVDAARSDGPTPTLLVHCEVGVSRSASLVIALLMRDDELSFLEAFEHTRARRVQVLPNLAFASQLQQLEFRLQPDRRGERPSSLAIYLHRYCSVPSEIDELEEALERHDHDAPAALRHLYGGEIPRVVQGTRSTNR